MSDIASNRPLRLLQVLEPSGGGSGRHFVDLCGALTERGHEVTAIYSPTRAEERFVSELKALPIKAVHAVPMSRAPSPSDFFAWRSINRIARAEGPFDVIHGHSSKAGALTRLRLPGPHVPRVYTPHAFRTMDPTLGSKGRLVFGSIESLLGRHFSDAIIAVSDDERRHAIESLGIPGRLLHTVVNGAVRPTSGRRGEIRARFGLAADAHVFGFVGRLSAQKAPERLIASFAEIVEDLPNSRLLMVGAGELEGAVRDNIVAHGLGQNVVLTSAITGADAMQAFDSLIMPSRYEAMSYVMLEAAAAGLPMVLTDVGGARTVVDNGANGLIVPNRDDTHELAEAMRTIASPASLVGFREAADERRNRYSLEAMAVATEAVYRSVAG